MRVQISAFAALVFGIWAIVGVVSVIGAALGPLLGVPAVICGLVALSERPAGRVRKAALAGVVTGVVGVAGFLLWIVLAVFGI